MAGAFSSAFSSAFDVGVEVSIVQVGMFGVWCVALVLVPSGMVLALLPQVNHG